MLLLEIPRIRILRIEYVKYVNTLNTFYSGNASKYCCIVANWLSESESNRTGVKQGSRIGTKNII